MRGPWRRNWNQETDPDFLDFLRSVVDSKVSHLVRRTENRTTRRMAGASAAEEAEVDLPDRNPDPAIECMDQDSLEKFRTAVVEEIAGDKLVEGIFSCLEAEITKPAEMAEVLDVKVKEVNNGQKRLRRKVEGLLKNSQKR